MGFWNQLLKDWTNGNREGQFEWAAIPNKKGHLIYTDRNGIRFIEKVEGERL